MRSIVLLVLLFAFICPNSADAATEAKAFTQSYLIANESDNSAVKTFSQNSFFFMPGLYVSGYGEADMRVKSEDPGLMILNQTINFSNDNSQYSGIITSHVLGRNLTELNVSISGMTSTGLYKEGNLSLVKSISSGLGLADPGDGNYTFYLVGGHYMNLDTSEMPLVYRKPLQAYEFSFQADNTELDEPADWLDQKVDLIYSVSPDYEQSYIGYDFSRTVEDGGINCQSNMEYGWVSDSE